MRTILLMVFLGVTLGVSAYVWNEKYQNQPGKVGAIGTSSTQAANVSKVTESTAGVPDVRGAKERCFDASKEAILKELRAPRSAVFADSTAGVKFERGEADSYKMESYVDAQNEFGAHIRMKWETLFDKDEKLVWMKIDDDEIEPLEDVLRRLKGLPARAPSERGIAEEEVERVKQAEAEARISNLKDPKNRQSLHAYAQKYLTEKMELQKHRNIKCSKLLKKDGKYTTCYWLGNDVWEATGVVESIPPFRRRPLRQPWKISMAVSMENPPEVLAYKLGKEEIGSPEIPRIRAGVKPTTSK